MNHDGRKCYITNCIDYMQFALYNLSTFVCERMTTNLFAYKL